MKVLSGAEQSALEKEREFFKAFTNYMSKRCNGIKNKARFLLGKSAYEYKIDVAEEYARFLEKTKRQAEPEFDAKIIAKLNAKLESDKMSSSSEIYKHSAEGLFEASRQCWNDALNKISEFCAMDLNR